MKTNTTQPLVSVIIPVFNGASYLVEAVTSVMTSTFKDFEVLLIDDGSTDQSKEICHLLEQKYPTVHFHSFTENRGLGRVLNYAIKNAKGKYICRLNQDDRMLPERIKTQVEYLQAHPDTVALGSCIYLFDEKGKTQIIRFLETDAEIRKSWLMVSPFADPSVMYSRDAAIAAGGYNQDFWPADDTQLWYRLGQQGKLANIQEPLVEVRWHDKAASVKFFRKLTLRLYQAHRWAHNNVQRASIGVQLFWLMQLIAGMLFSPQFNWAVYRELKKIINYFKGSNGVKPTHEVVAKPAYSYQRN